MRFSYEQVENIVNKVKKYLVRKPRPVLNKALLYKVADRLENERVMKQVGYNQNKWCRLEANSDRESCGTVACIAGHTVLEATELTPQEIMFVEYECTVVNNAYPTKDMARNLLGLTSSQANRLFDGDSGSFWVDTRFRHRYKHADGWDEKRKVAAEYLRAIADGRALY